MDNAFTKSINLIRRRLYIGDGEVEQCDRLDGAGATLVEPHVRMPGGRLRAAAFAPLAQRPFGAEEARAGRSRS